MNVKEQKILLSIDLPESFQKDSELETTGHRPCIEKITLGPDFILNALKDPEPAYSLKVLHRGQSKKEWYKLSNKMKLHLHVKQFVADRVGVDFGGNLKNFKWELV